jgi:hypothetical protein
MTNHEIDLLNILVTLLLGGGLAFVGYLGVQVVDMKQTIAELSKSVEHLAETVTELRKML